MTLKDLVIKLNGGVERGASANFAERLGVNRVTVSKWMGGEMPGEAMRPKIARLLGIPVDSLLAALREQVDGVREVGGRYSGNAVPDIDPAAFPEVLRKRIADEARKRFLDFQTTVVVLMGEFFGAQDQRQQGLGEYSLEVDQEVPSQAGRSSKGGIAGTGGADTRGHQSSK